MSHIDPAPYVESHTLNPGSWLPGRAGNEYVLVMPFAEEDLLRDLQRRTRELEALYETAGDLSSLRDVDQVLEAIVRRSRQLLSSDVAYLLLLDYERREAYMRVGDGIQTQEFLDIRLAFGEGIAGLVATTGMPLWTSDYSTDEHLAARIDATVKRESLVSILGVPLAAGSRILGVLLASDRRPREFTHDEVALLSSLAHHAAIALENASLFQDTQRAVDRWQEASTRVEQQNVVLERAAEMHEHLTRLVLEGAPVSALAEAVAIAVGGEVVILDAHGAPLTDGADTITPSKEDLDEALRAGGHAHIAQHADVVLHLVAVQAGARRLGYLAHRGRALEPADVRALERASMVTALLLLDRRAHEEARIRSLAQVFGDLTAREEPDLARVRRRAQASGVTLPEAPIVAAVGLASSSDDSDFNLDAIAQLALKEGWLARVEGRQVSLLAHATDPMQTAREVRERLTDSLGEQITVGAAGPSPSLADARDLLSKAQTCAKVLETTGQHGTASTPEELGVYALLLSDVGRERLDSFVTETIGPVRQWDQDRNGQLMHTLEAYFEEGGQTGKLAEALYVHVNTLYQRLERIDRLLGPEWRRGERALQVHLAVRLARLVSAGM